MFQLIYNNFFIKLVAFFSVLMGLYILFPFQIVSADGHSLNDTNSEKKELLETKLVSCQSEFFDSVS